MGWLIDTDLWIAVERGALAAADIHAVTGQGPIYLSPVNLAEIRFGLELMQAGPSKQRAARMLRRLRRKPQLRITLDTADRFGSLAARLQTSGRRPDVRVNDLWLAAQALQHGLGLLTANAKDFADIPDLRLVTVKVPRAPGRRERRSGSQ